MSDLAQITQGENTPTIFISYASRDRVYPFFNYLEKQGFNVWMDRYWLKPGQNWDFEINRALDKSTFVLFFISKLSYDRRGYLQRELKIALDKLKEKLIDDIYIIPVLLDDSVQIPDELKSIQGIWASDSKCYEQIADSLQHQLERIGSERRHLQEKEEIFWTSQIKQEEWDGIPGYEVKLQLLKIHSERYPNVSEIEDYIKGKLLSHLFEHREIKFHQHPESFNFTDEKYFRTSIYDSHCNEPIITGKIISISYDINWYGAGAAHDNYDFQTYSFLLEPLILIRRLEDIFQDLESAFKVLQAEARKQLLEVLFDEQNANEYDDTRKNWIEGGTEKWEHFHSFIFHQDGIQLLFPPYQVASFVDGTHSLKIPFEPLVSFMRNEYASALNVRFLNY